MIEGCASVKQPKEVFVQPDFNEKDVRDNEVKRINEMTSEFPVKALWRAKLMGNEEIVAKQEDYVAALYKEAVDKKNFFDAYRFYISLKACTRQL